MTNGNCRWAALMVAAISMMLAATATPAQTFTTLVNFDGPNGANPSYTALVQGADGNLYGTTPVGGTAYFGTVFKMTPAGALTTLYSFCAQTSCADGSLPYAGLTLGSDGNFYGTTSAGGASGDGTVFKITPRGTLTTLYSFCAKTNCSDGAWPYAALVQGSNGDFYGTTQIGGTSQACNGWFQTNGCGTVFEITPSGTLVTLHDFDGADGGILFAALVQGTDGSFYGTTAYGGAYLGDCQSYYADTGCGTVFRISPQGAFTTLHSFDMLDGYHIFSGLVQASDGNFYGATVDGGANGDGTVYKITPTGTFTTLHSFDGTDGWEPLAALVQATGGNLYGTTQLGGAGSGTVFKITTSGVLTTLHQFEGGDYQPASTLVQSTNGKLYGTTYVGGTGPCGNGCGTVFGLSEGLSPFVETQPTVGKVGRVIKILGTNLSGATSVTFDGTVATFTTSKSGTYISTSVPAGATTGPVQVVTPSGTLTSNVNFQVLP